MPKVSVIIPVFNGERFVGDAIESVLAQTYRDFELIVVDDGSEDQTAQKIKQYGDKLAYLYQPNSGQARAKNLGCSHAQGLYLAFLDSDDRWYSNKLEVQVELMEKNPQAGLIYSDVDLIDEGGKLLEKGYLTGRWSKKKRRLRGSVIGKHLFPYPSTVFLRKDVFEKAGGFDPSFYQNAEDFPLWARIYKLSEFIQVPYPLTQRRIHQKQASRGMDRTKEVIHMLNDLWNLFRDEPAKQVSLLRQYARTWSREGQRLIRKGNPKLGREYLGLSFRYYPFYLRNYIRIIRSYWAKNPGEKIIPSTKRFRQEKQEFEETKNLIDRIDGWIGKREAKYLYALAKEGAQKGVIVEIGSWKGKTTTLLAKASQAVCGKEVYAIDPHKGGPDQERFGYKHVNTVEEFRKNIREAGVGDIVIPMVMTSEEAVKDWNKPIGLLWIDGDHSYEAVKKDFLLWLPFVTQTGIIAFHDTYSWEGPRRVVEEYLIPSSKLSILGQVDGIAAAKKAMSVSALNQFKKKVILLLRSSWMLAKRYRLPARTLPRRIMRAMAATK